MRPEAEVVLFLAIAMLGVAAARRLGVLAPILLVSIGVAVSFVPDFPQYRLHPDLVLDGILPPMLYVAALETSVPAFRANLRPILLHAIGLVIFTAFTVGLVTHALLPDVPLAACVAFGAVVAPPDAISATAVARRIGLPRRVVTILEGESLINDASALVLLRVAAAAMLGSAVTVTEVGTEVVVAAGGGLLVGVLGAVVFSALHARIRDPLLDNALSLLTPFILLLVTNAIDASSVVAVVVAGLVLGHRMPVLMSAASRLQMIAFWRLVKFLLEGVVFLLVGSQLREVIAQLDPPWTRTALVTAAVLATVLAGRFLWVFPTAYLPRLVPRVRRRDPIPPPGLLVVVSWAGMRGVVTLAAALALPLSLAEGRPYPRALFIWLALAVIVMTLVVQGATLPVVARRLRLPREDPDEEAQAVAAVRREAIRAAREHLATIGKDAPPEVTRRLHQYAEERARQVDERSTDGRETPSQAYARLRRAMIEVEREVLRRARDDRRIPEEALVRAYHDLDLEESLLRGGLHR